MNYRKLTSGTLRQQHESILKSLISDITNADPLGEYGVRTYADWRQARDTIEDEMVLRSMPFHPITW